jgi:hypothetical protein
MSSAALSCGCATARDDDQPLLEQFAKVRDDCPALRLLLLPDNTWPALRAALERPPDDALHGSVLVLAFDRGHLPNVTSPIHRYLLQGDSVKAEVTRQYRQDLRERWLLKPDLLERHQRYRGFMGKLVELRVAEWLESQGWTIGTLEAYRPGPDIGALLHGEALALEVKYFDREDSDFLTVVESRKSGPHADSLDLYGAINYLVFRAYEAAKQLQRGNVPRRAVLLVVNETTWHRFDMQLEGEWIKWNAPAFYTNASPVWSTFLNGQRGDYPNIEADLGPAIADLEELWILKLAYGFALSTEYRIPIGPTPSSTL